MYSSTECGEMDATRRIEEVGACAVVQTDGGREERQMTEEELPHKASFRVIRNLMGETPRLQNQQTLQALQLS